MSLPLDLVLDAERDLLALFREAVRGFAVTREVLAAALFEHGHYDLMQEYSVGKGKDRRLVPGPNPENAKAVTSCSRST